MPNLEFFCSAQPQSLPGVPNPGVSQSVPKVFAECPAPDSLKCPTPESPWSAQPPECPVSGVPNPRVSLPREGGDVRSKIIGIYFRGPLLSRAPISVVALLNSSIALQSGFRWCVSHLAQQHAPRPLHSPSSCCRAHDQEFVNAALRRGFAVQFFLIW